MWGNHQDLSADEADKMEWLVRRKLNCFDVPTDRPIYEFYFEGGRWRPYDKFRDPRSAVLRRHSKALKIADLLTRKRVSVELRGSGGVGKTTLLAQLAETNRSDVNLTFQGGRSVSLPSANTM